MFQNLEIMGFGVPGVPRGGKAGRGFLQQQTMNSKWKGKKNQTRNIASRSRHYDVPLSFRLQNAPAEMPFKNLATENTFSFANLRSRNRPKRRRILGRMEMYPPRAPFAPRNTTSFIMRAKKLGGIAPPVTPSPATPALFPTPELSPGLRGKGSPEEMNKELGVDGYGSMNGLIRLRSYDDRARGASESESDVDQEDFSDGGQSLHSVERLEQRIDQGLSRFEMIYPSRASDFEVPKYLENCVNSQERIITRLEEENLTLKERLFLVEQEVNELRQRVRELEGCIRPEELLEERCEDSCGDVLTPRS